MATNKVKRSIHLAQPQPQPQPQHAKTARTAIPDRAKAAQSGSPGAGGPESQRRSPNQNPEQILRPKNGLRISPAGSQPHQTRLHARKAAQPADLTPVKSHVYQAIAELNAGLEKAIHNLQMLQSNQLFGASGLTAMNHVLRGVRARANCQLMMALNERETANARHFQQQEQENR